MTKTLKILRDENPESPREHYNVGHMICAHRRYKLGDEQSTEPLTEDELREDSGALIVLPLYLLDHSGLSISTKPFGDRQVGRWDSGQVGWVYATEKSIREIWLQPGDAITPEILEKVEAAMVCEVAEYDAFLSGNVWGFVVEETTHCEHCNTDKVESIDSCWGFIGDDKEGIALHLEDDVKPLLDEAWSNRQ